MSRYIDADKLQKDGWKLHREKHGLATSTFETMELDCVPSADVVEGDKAQKEVDYWHDLAQSYEQTILKLSLNKADVVEVVRCKDCKHFEYDHWGKPDDNGVSIIVAHEICNFWGGGCKTSENGYCSYGEQKDE